MTSKSGYIPEKVTYFCRPKKTTVNGRPGTPAFPVADMTIQRGLKTAEIAKKWAHGSNAYFGDRWKTSGPEVEVENKPRDGFRIVGAEQRSEGGRAWKVLTPEGYLVDLREDVFLPILLKRGLPASGIIPAKLQWCQNGSQLRLEEVGSKSHSSYYPSWEASQGGKKAQSKKAATERKQKPRVKTSELEIGRTYLFPNYGGWDHRVYLGRTRDPVSKKKLFLWLEMWGEAVTSQKKFDLRLLESQGKGWKHALIVSTGCTAERVRPTPKLTLPEESFLRQHCSWVKGGEDLNNSNWPILSE